MINIIMRRKLTTKEFIKRAKKIHSNLYDYSKVEYINNNTKICIIDPEYGEFWQTPAVHLGGSHCSARGHAIGGKALSISTNEFIKRAKKIYDKLYDYSKVEYINNNTKICIIDPIYGEFWQRPNNHLSGAGNPSRAFKRNGNKQRRIVSEKFINRARKIHSDLYDYSKVKYIKNNEKVCIIDPKYGEFWQQPASHLNGHGCLLRSNDNISEFHNDHIIPLSILGSRFRGEVDCNRPLYKILDSDINIQKITGGENIEKSDWIEYKGKQIRARSIKNDYIIIAYLMENLLDVDSIKIIEEDKKYLTQTIQK